MPTFELDIFVLFILFGALQGAILALILLKAKRLRKKSNIFLALLLINFAFLNLTSGLELTNASDKYQFLDYMPSFWVLSLPVLAYYFVTYLINPSYEWKKKDYYFLLPFGIEISHRLYRCGKYLLGHNFTQEENNRYYFISNTYEVIAVIATIFVLILSIKRLRTYEAKLYENYAEVKDKSLQWLRDTLVTGLLISVLWLVVTITDYSVYLGYKSLALTLLLGISILIYWIGYSMIIRQELLVTPVFGIEENDSTDTVQTSELSVRTDEHYQKLLDLVSSEKIYQNPNLNMTMLAEQLELSNGYVSQIINQKEKKNFFDFINSYRIEEVKLNMANPAFAHYTILGIAQEAGFKSKSTFNSVFKKFTGKTPSEFKKGDLA